MTFVRTRFIDQATIQVEAGRGGKGCISFYQDKWTRYPIPDGADGGRGGHVFIRANPQLTTLLDFQQNRHFRGGPGTHGSSKKKQGAQGKDRFIEVPLGTVVWDDPTGDLIREILEGTDEVLVAKGGAGGLGNAVGRNARQRLSPESIEGSSGERRGLRLELKLVADVGIVGLPNAGKSTLIRQISGAKPKVASFPFTTVSPVLGAAALPTGECFIAVDVPGLIKGAHEGRGLGLAFLRHIERTRILVHLIDMAGVDGRDPVEDYETLNAELAAYNPTVAEIPQILVANKMDLLEAKKNLIEFRKKVKKTVYPVSAQKGEGVDRLLSMLSEKLKHFHKENE